MHAHVHTHVPRIRCLLAQTTVHLRPARRLPLVGVATWTRAQHTGSGNGRASTASRWTPLPLGVGVAVLCWLQWRHEWRGRAVASSTTTTSSSSSSTHVSALVTPPDDDYDDQEARVLGGWRIKLLKTLPMRTMSRWWGHVNSAYDLPVWLRAPVYRLWTHLFDCNLSEMDALQLEDYPNLQAFFTRRLKEGVRPVDERALLVSPADARVLHFGPIDQRDVEQVKGVTYSLDAFIGCGQHSWDVEEKYHQVPYNADKGNRLYHCVLYLAPGDYHRFHSSVDWAVEKLKHFDGKLFSVSPGVVRMIQGLFVLNERIVMLGQWEHGFFSTTAVGATNVGSIQLAFDESFETNRRIREPQGSYTEKCLITNRLQSGTPGKSPIPKQTLLASSPSPPPLQPGTNKGTAQGLHIRKGQELGQFNLGSTIVLVFEAPANFKFTIKADQKVRVGQSIGILGETGTDLDDAMVEMQPRHGGGARSLAELEAEVKSHPASAV